MKKIKDTWLYLRTCQQGLILWMMFLLLVTICIGVAVGTANAEGRLVIVDDPSIAKEERRYEAAEKKAKDILAKQAKNLKAAKKLQKKAVGSKKVRKQLYAKVKKVKSSYIKVRGLRAKLGKGAYGYSLMKPLVDKAKDRWSKAKTVKAKVVKAVKKAQELLKDQASKARSLRYLGRVHSGSWTYTWCSQKVLPGGGLRIPGRHVGNAGLIMDGQNRVCVASSSLSWGTVLETPYGTARVYDCGCPYGVIDVYTNW